ncbi:hypothetical protein M422DRAFT_242196 [Sphaerobolus stellatus SS14]|nr:hypothetical protein M422DRAFT_242196 [Sphaerobolus stellatus SS14]
MPTIDSDAPSQEPGPSTRGTMQAAQPPQSTDFSAADLVVQRCLDIIERRRRGEITTADAILDLQGILPASETQARRSYIDMCLEIDREHALAATRGSNIADQLSGVPNSTFGSQPVRVQGQDFDPRQSQTYEPDQQNRGSSPVEGDENRAKQEPGKRSLDRTKLPWHNIPDPVLPPNLQDTLDRKRFYLANAKDVKIDILGRANCPALPDGSWHDVIVGNFVDLDKIHSQRDSLEADSEFIQSIGDMEFRVRDSSSAGKPSKTVKNQSDWIVAFQTMQTAVVFVYPGRKEELEAYETFMAGQFAAIRTEEHHRVIALDKALRKQAAKNNSCTLLTLPNFQAICTQQLNPIGRASAAKRMSLSTSPSAAVSTETTVLGPAVSNMPVPIAKRGTKRKTVPATGEGIEDSTPSASSTVLAQPLPSPPLSELNNRTALDTIKNNPSLFKIVTPINISRFEELLASHPNQLYVASVCRGLREGFWPHAEIPPNSPESFDFSARPQMDEAMAFLREQRDKEIAAGRFSPAFRPELLPGMYSGPIEAIPKPQSSGMRMITDQSTGPHALNSFIPKQAATVRYDNMHDLGKLLRKVHATHNRPPAYLFKSDCSEAFRRIPMHPLWQIRQIVTIDGEWHVDRCLVFGNRGAPNIWCAFMALVMWIAIHVKFIADMLHYMDDAFSYEMGGSRSSLPSPPRFFPRAKSRGSGRVQG